MTSDPAAATPYVIAEGSSSGPSKGWYWVAAVIAVLGIVGAVFVGIRGVTQFTESLGGLQRIDVPGEGVVELDQAGGYYVFYEGPFVPNHLVVIVTDTQGTVIEVQPYGGDLTYTSGGRSGTAIGTFDVDAPGTYGVTVSSEDASGGQIAIGQNIAGGVFGLVGGIFAAIGVASLAFIIAIVIIVIVAVGRSRARRRSQPPPVFPQPGPFSQPPYGQSPYGQPPGPYGQPPYGQPPYGQPPYGQPPYGQPPYGQPPPAAPPQS